MKQKVVSDSNPRPRCEKCGAASVVFRKDKTYTCRRCGHDSRESQSGDVK